MKPRFGRIPREVPRPVSVRQTPPCRIAILFWAFVLQAADGPYRLVNVDVSGLPRVRAVVDGRPARDGSRTLRANDFRLRADGAQMEAPSATRKFRETGNGVALVVALDASQSMNGRPLAAIRQGLAKLVSRRREQDRVAVLSFADDVRWETRWDAAGQAVENTLKTFQTRGKRTALYDGLAEALNELSAESGRNAAFPARQAILVISDGHDEGSRTSLEALTKRLRASRVRLDATGLAWTPAWFPILQSLAASGFGDFRAASTPESLSGMVERGIDMLLDEPVLEFEKPDLPRDGKSHPVGLSHTSGWKEDLNVTLTELPLWKRPLAWGGAAALAGLVGWLLLRGRASQPKPAPANANSPAAAAAVNVKSETAANPRLKFVGQNPPPIARTPTPAEVFDRGAKPEPSPAPPRRAETELAPSASATAPRALRGVQGPYTGQRFELTADEFWIGSRENNQLCLSADPGASGNHACVRREKNILRLYDNGSLNNTWINGRALGRDIVILREGDRVRIGESEFILEA